jgi:hypothetical protein
MNTIKVKPWGKGQGDYVIINADDFDPSKHEKFDAPLSADEILQQAKPKAKAGK